MQNTILSESRPAPVDEVAGRIAKRSVARKEEQAASEVRRLLDAGLAVMRSSGTTASPRVADIVAAAGLSNDAFYRHFASKEALVVAILEDGSVRLAGYLRHQMEKDPTAAGQVRRWVEGVMGQASNEDAASTTRAVLWNGGMLSERAAGGQPSPAATLATLLQEPVGRLGSADPPADAILIAHAVVGMLSDCLRQRTRPDAASVAAISDFCLAGLTAGSGGEPAGR